MSLSLIIYLASISFEILAFLLVLAFLLLIGTLASISLTKSPWRKWSAAFMFVLLIWALVPDSDSIYKMAGVTAQERGKLDAAGNLIKESSK